VFDELFGLPAHPLMVHAPVVLVPLTALIAIGYALLPPLRRRVGWLLVLAGLAGAGTGFGAVESGKKLAERTGGTTPAILEHQGFGENLRNLAVLMAVVAVVLVVVDMARHGRSRPTVEEDEDGYHHARPRSGGLMLGAVSVVLSLGLLGAAGGAAYFAVRAGHTGATMVWGTQ
jgi:hypothetical protein